SQRAQGVGDASAASVGPSRSGMWDGAPESPPSVRPGGRTDDEGGPGDTPASVAWLRAGRGTGYAAERERLVPRATIAAGGRALDPESGMPVSPDRSIDRTTDRLGRPNHWAGASRAAPAGGAANRASGGSADPRRPELQTGLRRQERPRPRSRRAPRTGTSGAGSGSTGSGGRTRIATERI